jgi:hypothetical protein
MVPVSTCARAGAHSSTDIVKDSRPLLPSTDSTRIRSSLRERARTVARLGLAKKTSSPFRGTEPNVTDTDLQASVVAVEEPNFLGKSKVARPGRTRTCVPPAWKAPSSNLKNRPNCRAGLVISEGYPSRLRRCRRARARRSRQWLPIQFAPCRRPSACAR